MKKFSEQLHIKASATRLRAGEKRALKERIVSYMEYHPLPAALKSASQVGPSQATEFSEAITLVRVNWRRVMQFGVAGIGVLFLSITYIAEQAVPGDTLYAVKVSFTEELRSTLARTSYEKVVWETERLNRRIAEARLLASAGKLTEEAEEKVAQAVKVHSDNARREIDSLKQTDREGAALASIQLSTTLDVQSVAMRSDEENNLTSGGQSTNRIASAITASQAAEAIEETLELPSYDRLMAKVEQESTRAYELLASVKKLASASEQADIKRRMEDIERAILEALALRSDDELAARSGLLAVLQRTQRLIIFMTNIDVRTHVSVEQIVPVTKTTEERLFEVKQGVVEAKTYLKAMTEEVLVAVEPDLLEKVGPAVAEGERLIASVEASLADGGAEVADLEVKTVEALALLKDVAVLIGVSPVLEKTEGGEVADAESVVEVPTTISTTTTDITATSTADKATSSPATNPRATSSPDVNLTEV